MTTHTPAIRIVRAPEPPAGNEAAGEGTGLRFAIEFLASDGGRTVVWTGLTYDDAILASRPWEERGCLVVDLVV